MEAIDPESLSASEVLAHLKQLGYQNISSLQLREFMHDLKKLIRYEQKCRQGFGSVFDENYSAKTVLSSSDLQSFGNDCSLEEDSGSTDSNELCENCNLNKTEPVRNVLPKGFSSTTESDYKRKKIELGQQTIRPQPSFIRPWRLQPFCKGPVTGSVKTDPVRLYHKYKEIWAHQKVPGEKSHSQLRWTVREKMLGQDPQPRPISQASTEYRSKSMSCK